MVAPLAWKWMACLARFAPALAAAVDSMKIFVEMMKHLRQKRVAEGLMDYMLDEDDFDTL